MWDLLSLPVTFSIWIWRKKLCGLQISTFRKFHKIKYVRSNKTVNSFNKLIDLINYTSNELEKLYSIWYNIAKNLEKVTETCPKAPNKVTPIIATIILHIMLCLEEITLPKLKHWSHLIHSYRIHLSNIEQTSHIVNESINLPSLYQNKW